MREAQELVARDNVVFEAGLAIGILGKQRVFILSHHDTALPKDLDGLTVYQFRPDETGSVETSLRNELTLFRDKLIENPETWRKSPVYLSEHISDRISDGVHRAKTIWVIGPVLASFLETYESEIMRRLSDVSNPLEKLVVVLRDPWGVTKNLVSIHAERYSESATVTTTITASIAILQKLRFAYPEKVEIRILDHPFMCSSYVFDAYTDNCNVCVQYNPFGDVNTFAKI